MTGKDVIKELMKNDNIGNIDLAERVGVTQATMWARLNNQSAKDMPLSVFTEILSAMGYELVARRRSPSGLLTEIPVQIDAPTKPEGRGRPKKTPPRSDGNECSGKL